MGFLKTLFGGKDQSPKKYVDKQGVYFYVQCDNCGTPVRIRADKTYDLANEGDGYVWHKTIVDNRCFRQMPTVVHLNNQYEMVAHEITGGHYISEEEYNGLLAEQEAKRVQSEPTTADPSSDPKA
ncbi:MAG: hypothetical protein R3C44_04165 [Chloroflexota bacterium]